ncbi:MAG: hypothetical protein IJ224_04605 [Lachnospiraceae bacterium]|nr:hypothetical protein [Lachnospiraceae bacterium]
MKKMKKKLLAVLAVVGLLTGSMSVLADSGDEGVLCEDGYIEYTEYPGEDELVPMEPVIGPIYETDTIKPIDEWEIETGHSATSTIFGAVSGNTINVSVVIDPADTTVKVGIVQPDGTRRYVTGETTVGHSFALHQTGNYKVYVENNSGVTVIVTGTYVY